MERLRCCVNDKVNVRIVDGRALLLDPDTKDKLLFGNEDDPIAWVHNGLSGNWV